MDGVSTKHFATDISGDDEHIYGCPRGSSTGQQLWEALAILVAVDIWAMHWQQHRIILKIRGDNVGALTLLIKMRPDNSKMAIVARELALRMIELSFPPDAAHTPGIAHVLADKLSRIHAPGGSGSCKDLHPAIAQATETVAPVRKPAWYRALDYEPAVSKR